MGSVLIARSLLPKLVYTCVPPSSSLPRFYPVSSIWLSGTPIKRQYICTSHGWIIEKKLKFDGKA